MSDDDIELGLEVYHVPTMGELAVIRRALGIYQTEVAEDLGYSVRTIGAWENEKSKPKIDDVKKLIAYYRAKQ